MIGRTCNTENDEMKNPKQELNRIAEDMFLKVTIILAGTLHHGCDNGRSRLAFWASRARYRISGQFG